MDDPLLAPEERAAINSGKWFKALSPALRHDLLRRAVVRRFEDGECFAAQGAPHAYWWACAKGSARVTSTNFAGRRNTLGMVRPGVWFGDVAVFDGALCTHDAYAYGDTTILAVSKGSMEEVLSLHVELYEALLQLLSRRTRHLFAAVQDLMTLPLRPRLAKQIAQLVRTYGITSEDEDAVRIDLKLPQEEIARMLGASRQRMNLELKGMERENVIRINRSGLVILDHCALMRIGQSAS